MEGDNMDILVLADSYSHFKRFIQSNGYIIKSFMKDDPAEDEDGNKYYFCSMYTDSMCGRCFDKIIDIRVLSVNVISRLRNLTDAEIDFGGITFTYGKRKNKE